MRKKSRGLFILILILATLATILVGWRLFAFKPQSPIPQPSPTPTPSSRFILTPTPSPFLPGGKGDSPQEVLRSLKENFPLWEFVPYQNPSFSVDYLAPLSLQAILKKDTPEARQEVLDWILSKGVNPSTHQIQWKIGL